MLIGTNKLTLQGSYEAFSVDSDPDSVPDLDPIKFCGSGAKKYPVLSGSGFQH
jgi:hypothetical protein